MRQRKRDLSPLGLQLRSPDPDPPLPTLQPRSRPNHLLPTTPKICQQEASQRTTLGKHNITTHPLKPNLPRSPTPNSNPCPRPLPCHLSLTKTDTRPLLAPLGPAEIPHITSERVLFLTARPTNVPRSTCYRRRTQDSNCQRGTVIRRTLQIAP